MKTFKAFEEKDKKRKVAEAGLRHLAESQVDIHPNTINNLSKYKNLSFSKAGVVEAGLKRLAEDQVDIHPNVTRVRMFN